jgi:hypothetical protein
MKMFQTTTIYCPKAGQDIRTDDNSPTACLHCKGEIKLTIKNNRLFRVEFVESIYLFPLPREPITDFTCPALLPDPRESEVFQ